MDGDLAAKIAEAHAQLADYRTRVSSSLLDSHHTVRKTTALIAEARELILLLDRLSPR